MSSNEEQIRYWNDDAGEKWVQLQERLDRQIGPLGDHMIELAAPRDGDVVIDVGCGCGATTLELARRVSPSGRVTGVDISGPMLRRARVRAAEAGVTNVGFEQADAQVHAFEPGAASLVTSRFGVMFFADPTAAFSNLNSALGDSGRLAFVCWQPITANPWMLVPVAAAMPIVPDPPPPPDPTAPGPFAFGDPNRVRSILEGAGFAKIEIAPDQGTLVVGGDAPFEETVDFVLKMGPLGRLLAGRSELEEKARDAVAGALDPYRKGDEIEMEYACWLVSAAAR